MWTSSALTFGNYNGDGTWDILISTGSVSVGTLLQLGTASLGFTGFTFADSRFHFYDSVLYSGDYNGDGKDDFLASTSPSLRHPRPRRMDARRADRDFRRRQGGRRQRHTQRRV